MAQTIVIIDDVPKLSYFCQNSNEMFLVLFLKRAIWRYLQEKNPVTSTQCTAEERRQIKAFCLMIFLW